VASFYVENFGCRATQADGAALERQFRERGLERAAAASQAQVVVLNTCTVTASADQDARAAIRRIRRQNPGCQILVTGCYAQRAPQEIAALPGVSQVIGNSHKHDLVSIAMPSSAGHLTTDGQQPTLSRTAKGPTTEDERRVFVSDIFAHTELLAAPVFEAANERTRPNLKVQDGCDNRCSFCVIPFVRGHNRSLPLSEILREVQALVEAGYREVVISGINLGRWGRDLPNSLSSRPKHSLPLAEGSAEWRDPVVHSRLRFEDLLRAILDETPLEKLRISSVEPMDWSDELIRLVAECPRIAKHAHVPMQSASDRILRLMHRKYHPWHYREKIEKIHAAMPTAAIGADVMVGFPGETDADFELTRRMIEALPFTYLHVFSYSARPGTPAASMRNQVPVQIARERNRVLRELAGEKHNAFMQSFVGGTVEAITLRSGVAPAGVARAPLRQAQGRLSPARSSRVPHPSGVCLSGVVPIPDPHAAPALTECLTDNYLKLHLAGHHEPNRWLHTRVEGVEDGVLVGSPM
jgi:threonylcarbamoyladenosine tRNA methylthiotransferase MtaB